MRASMKVFYVHVSPARVSQLHRCIFYPVGRWIIRGPGCCFSDVGPRRGPRLQYCCILGVLELGKVSSGINIR